jgi:PST family polysaccharide transporter
LAGINSGVQTLVGVIGLIFAIKKFNLNFVFPNVVLIKKQLRNGGDLFKSTIAINLYTNSNIFILGLLTNEQVAGYYSAADKIRIAAQGILGPISQSIFPHVSYLIKESKEKFIRFNSRLLKLQGLLAFFISLLIFLFASQIGYILLGKEFSDSVDVLRILAWLPFVISISNVYGIQTMLPMNFEKEFFNIVGTAALINLVLLFTLIPGLKEIGTAISFLISETIVTITMASFCGIKGINLFKYEV